MKHTYKNLDLKTQIIILKLENMKFPIKDYYLFCLIIFWGIFISSCGTSFIPTSDIRQIQQSGMNSTHYIFYDQSFRIDKNATVSIYIHKAFVIGKDSGNIDKQLFFLKNDIYRFKKLLIRHYSGKKVKSFTKHDLVLGQTSNSRMISDDVIMYLNIPDKHPGDIIEICLEVDYGLPFLGLDFSLDEVDIIADKVKCTFEMAPGIELEYQTINHDQIPTDTIKNGNRIITFSWQNWTPLKKNRQFQKRNSAPQIIANSPNFFATTQLDWIQFGNKYLEIIDHRLEDSSIDTLAQKIVADCTDEIEKMQAIVIWCKKNIRYEQVYIEKGQFIPNSISDIINRKFGDCKDYSLTIYSLAQKVGLKPHIALCYLGKDFELNYKIPNSHFNHMIVYWKYQDQDYWFDGTNRSSLPGIFSDKLINQNALVIEKDNSRIKRMAELPDNLLKISANLEPYFDCLNGSLYITLNNQYAALFIYLTYIENDLELTNTIHQWCCHYLNSDIIIRNVKWSIDERSIQFTMNVMIPKPIVIVDNKQYISLKQIFPRYFSDEIFSTKPEEIFYNPIYGHGLFDVNILLSQDNITNLSLSYDLPDGPFMSDNSADFYDQYTSLLKIFSKTSILNKDN